MQFNGETELPRRRRRDYELSRSVSGQIRRDSNRYWMKLQWQATTRKGYDRRSGAHPNEVTIRNGNVRVSPEGRSRLKSMVSPVSCHEQKQVTQAPPSRVRRRR